jgi:RimJ/RimL family protein N-acetyltransferase
MTMERTPESASQLRDWTPRPLPGRQVLEGRHVRLEPLDPERHGDGLFLVSTVADVAERFRWLLDLPPVSREAFGSWLETAAASLDPLFFAVIDRATGEVGGRQAMMRIDAKNGVIEIGSIYWGPRISRQPAATEAFLLFARYIFETLGYRRLEWKCDNRNLPSRRAALRFGMVAEGIFRQHMVVKGESRDTAWFSMLDHEWPAARRAFERWLDPANFDAAGNQIRRLEEFREMEGQKP